MKAYYIDEKTDKARFIDVEPNLDVLYKLTQCDCIDIAMRDIEGNPVNIVVDDEGLLTGRRTTATSINTKEVLVGSILVFGVAEDGDLAPVSSRLAGVLLRRTIPAPFEDGTFHTVLWYSR